MLSRVLLPADLVYTDVSLHGHTILKTPCLAFYNSNNNRRLNTNFAPDGGSTDADFQHAGRPPGALAEGAMCWVLVLEVDHKSYFPIVIL